MNLECVVRPHGSISKATPEAATARTTFPNDLKYEIITIHKKVFPVPPWPKTKMRECFFISFDVTTAW